jgi:hypothetical protein
MPAPKTTKTTPAKKAAPRKVAVKTATTTRKPAVKKAPVKKAATPVKKTPAKAETPVAPGGFIDKALMEKAIELRGEGKTMKEIGVLLNVKATAYLAKKIKDTFGADALDRPRRES